MRFNHPEDIIALTPQWKGERFADGRPKVPDQYLDKLYDMTLEELWKPIFVKGYENQFLSIQGLHPEFKEDGTVNRKLVGRAVTAAYAPARPDYYETSSAQAAREGWKGTPNQWVVDCLTSRDVAVIDMYDKIYKGTFLGGNLTTALHNQTNNGGAVIWGGIRDVEQMRSVPDVQVYYRGIDPTPIRDFVMTSFNAPVCLGSGEHCVLCLPGDVVYGCGGGVLFIPPHLVVEVVENGAKTQVKDMFGFAMITANRFTTAEIDKNIWSVEMLDLLQEYIKTTPEATPYRQLDWSTEYEAARSSTADKFQSAL